LDSREINVDDVKEGGIYCFINTKLGVCFVFSSVLLWY